MEDECGIPNDYFDIVYSIYAVGWALDLNVLFKKIASYLRKDGIFIFSWKHPIHGCVAVEGDALVFKKNYFDEGWNSIIDSNMELLLTNRKISTYINALSNAGFIIEQMVEQTDDETLQMTGTVSDRTKKAQKLPLSFVFKVRKG